MRLEEIDSKTNEILRNFVNCLGLDGNYYVSVNKCPIIFGRISSDGRFFTAGSSELKHFLDKLNVDDEKKKEIFDEGLIVINNKFNNNSIDNNLLVSVIHEKLHSNRMILLNSQHSMDAGINGVFFDDKKFVQNTDSNKAYYADAAQDILTGSVDNSRKTIKKYSAMSYGEKEDILFDNTEYDDKMFLQGNIDEALVEVMAIISYCLYSRKTNDIMQIVKEINMDNKADDMKAITNIILRHNDLELFKWMIDPLSYQAYDVNYDFFSHYVTKEDLNDLNIIYDSEELSYDSYLFNSTGVSRK